MPVHAAIPAWHGSIDDEIGSRVPCRAIYRPRCHASPACTQDHHPPPLWITLGPDLSLHATTCVSSVRRLRACTHEITRPALCTAVIYRSIYAPTRNTLAMRHQTVTPPSSLLRDPIFLSLFERVPLPELWLSVQEIFSGWERGGEGKRKWLNFYWMIKFFQIFRSNLKSNLSDYFYFFGFINFDFRNEWCSFCFEKEKFISLSLFYGKEQVETFNQETTIREEKKSIVDRDAQGANLFPCAVVIYHFAWTLIRICALKEGTNWDRV